MINLRTRAARQREVVAQIRLQAALENSLRRGLLSELRRVTNDAARIVAARGDVSAAFTEHEDAITRLMIDRRRRTMRIFGDRFFDAVGKASLILFEKKDRESIFEEAITAWLRDLGAQKIAVIADTTRASILNVIADTSAEGLGEAAIASAIRKKVGAISKVRAQTIARTEVHTAANAASVAAAEASDLSLKKEWIASFGPRTRPSHAAADGQIVEMDETFQVGSDRLMHPGDPSGSAREIINCLAPWSLVSHAGLKRAMMREYVGDLIELSFGRPINLTVTMNHPILTQRGWVPAYAIVEGDYFIDCRIGYSGVVSSGFDIENGISRADHLYDAAQNIAPRVRASGVVVDFHGERPAHDVDIVTFEGKLRDTFKAAGSQLFECIDLSGADIAEGALLFQRMGALSYSAPSYLSYGFMSGSSAAFTLGGGVERCATTVAFGDAGTLQSQIGKAPIDHGPGDIEIAGDPQNGISCFVKPLDVSEVHGSNALPMSGNAFGVVRCSGVKRFHYTGPVYNFETDSGLIVAQGIVNHNCRCATGWITRDL